MKFTTQPAKHIKVPEGSTHWNPSYSYPFEKHEHGERYIFIEDDWVLFEDEKGRLDYVELCDLKYQSNVIVMTPLGRGILIDDNLVDLDESSIGFRPCRFDKKEIIKIKE